MRWYQHRFHSVAALQLMFRSMPRIPRVLHPVAATFVALFFYFALKRERAAVARNLQQITGSRGPALRWKVYRVFYSFSDSMVSYCYIPQASHAELRAMLVDDAWGREVVGKYLEAGKGVILWTAHLGNSEFASRLLELHGRPVSVARVVEDSPAEQMLRQKMASERLRVIDLKNGAAATLELLAALRRNEIVAIQGDRVYNQRHNVELEFFSRRVSFPVGPFLLAQVSGAPVLPGFAIRESWMRYRMIGGVPIVPGNTGDLQEEQRAALTQAVRFLESQLAVHYDQWVNFFDFWPAHE